MANGTPESEFSIECFQNYTAPEVFIQGLAGMVNQTDVETMIRAQKQMLQRFEKTNEMLTNCNALSASRLKLAGAEFKKHTQLLIDMKKDLDYIFKKIRAIKQKLSTQYPEAYEIAQKSSLANVYPEDDEELEQEAAKKSSNLSKDISKSTETLRPSISQVFSRSPNDPENAPTTEMLETPKVEEAETSKEILSELQENAISEEATVTEIKSIGKNKNLKLAAGDKEKRNSSTSSSSDNSNTCESSGDCTSDTG